MIKKIILSCCLLIACVCQVSGAERLFRNLKKTEGLTSVYVGKAMLEMAGNLNLGVDVIDGSDLIDSLDSVEVFNASTTNAIRLLKNETELFISKNKGLEIAFLRESDEESVVIYTDSPGAGLPYSRLLMVVEEEDEFVVINLQGIIPLDALDNIHL